MPDTPTGHNSLVSELRDAAQRIDAVRLLQLYGTAPTIIEGRESRKFRFFLLKLDASEMRLVIQQYKANQLIHATADYLTEEKRITHVGGDAVLVSVDSLASLRRAYPNYYLDTNMFVDLTEAALRGNFNWNPA